MSDSLVPGAREFHTTRWSVVLAAQGAGDRGRSAEALATLCRDYWYPLYAFVRRRGYSPHDAQDLTQSFFVTLLEDNATAADPSRGRFRSYLLGALKHFLANDWNRQRAAKRGGGRQIVAWDALEAESRYALEPSDGMDADLVYDRRWALEILARAMETIRSEFEGKGERETFEALKGSLNGEEPPRAELAERLGLSEGALKVAIHRLRQRFREALRAEVAQTVDAPGAIDEEMRHLVAVLRAV